MSITNFRLNVYDWNGTYRHTRSASDANPALIFSIPADGIEAAVSGDGDCLEMTFQGLYPSLLIEERDLLELDTYDASDGGWKRRYAGVVVKSGNSQVRYDHTNFKATGLRKRLQEVQVTYDLPEADAAEQFRLAVQSAIDSGQLGQAVTVSASDCPTSGILEAGKPTRDRNLGELLDYLAARTNRTWGVDAARRVYFRDRGSAVINLTEGDLGVLPTFEDTDSEALVTRVPFIIGQDDAGLQIRYTVTLPEATQYGVATKPEVILDEAIQPYGGAPTPTLLKTPDHGTVAVLIDGQTEIRNFTTYDHLEFSVTASDTQLASVEVPVGGRLLTLAAALTVGGPDLVVQVADAEPVIGSDPPVYTYVYGPRYRLHNEFRVLKAAVSDRARIRLDLDWSGASLSSAAVYLSEFRVDVIDTALLGALADFHSVLPTRDPATITVLGRVIEPAPDLVMARLDGSFYTNPVESVSLQIKLTAGMGANGSIATVIKAGQRLPAEERALHFLNQRSIDQAAATVANARS